MKKYTLFIVLFALCFGNVNAQKMKFVFGADGNYYLPIGGLGDRFDPAYGGAIYFGKEVSKTWTWTGKLEYFKFDKGNKDKLHLLTDLTVNNQSKTYDVPLENLDVQLEVVGLSANAKYKVIEVSDFTTNISFGFGVYRWYSPRGKYSLYFDSSTEKFYSDTTGVGGNLTKVVNVPGISQVDWSGGFNVGLQFEYQVAKNLNVYAGGEYKNVIGEIWQALALNLENISSFQMINLKIGVNYQL